MNTNKYIKEQIVNLEYKLNSKQYNEKSINKLLEELHHLDKNSNDDKRIIMKKLETITIHIMDLPKNTNN